MEVVIVTSEYQVRSAKGELRINGDIAAARVRLVDEHGENIGIVALETALERAGAADLDLVELVPEAEPPVCKILNYSKYRYAQRRRRIEARKRQKTIDIKEIKIRPNIEKHDYEVKMRSARRFLGGGDKVKVTMRFRGREAAHQEFGMDVLKRICEDLKDLARVEQRPQSEDRQIVMLLGPVK